MSSPTPERMIIPLSGEWLLVSDKRPLESLAGAVGTWCKQSIKLSATTETWPNFPHYNGRDTPVFRRLIPAIKWSRVGLKNQVAVCADIILIFLHCWIWFEAAVGCNLCEQMPEACRMSNIWVMMNDECKISDLDRHQICKVMQRCAEGKILYLVIHNFT